MSNSKFELRHLHHSFNAKMGEKNIQTMCKSKSIENFVIKTKLTYLTKVLVNCFHSRWMYAKFRILLYNLLTSCTLASPRLYTLYHVQRSLIHYLNNNQRSLTCGKKFWLYNPTSEKSLYILQNMDLILYLDHSYSMKNLQQTLQTAWNILFFWKVLGT